MAMLDPESVLIEISYVGNYNEKVPADTFLVETNLDYVKACNAVVTAFKDSLSLCVWVRQTSHLTWLKRYVEATNIQTLFSEKTPRVILSDIWDVPIPDWLDDKTVTAQRLLDLKPTDTHSNRFENAMLVLFFGSVFEANHLNVDNIGDLISALSKSDSKGYFDRYPILYRCLEEKCKTWKDNTDMLWVLYVTKMIDC